MASMVSVPLEFFKVFLSSMSSNSLGLPPAITLSLEGELLEECTIKDNHKSIWKMKLERSNGILTFRQGWKEFSTWHKLKDGDFLIFKYTGHAQFEVNIFGKNGIRKDAFLPTDRNSNFETQKSSKTTGNDQDKRCFTAMVTRRKKTPVTISAKWIDTNKVKLEDTLTLIVDGKSQRWTVRILRNANRTTIGKGWGLFRSDNNLMAGDICIFKLVHSKGGTTRALMVHIVRNNAEN